MYMSEVARILLSERCTGNLRMFAGADILFFQEWPEYCRSFMEAAKVDMCFAWDGHVPCMDFICFFDRLETRGHLLNCAWTTFGEAQRNTPDGQSSLAFVNNQFVNAQLLKRVGFTWACFPGDVVCNWATVSQTQTLWSGQSFTLPNSSRVFHANWTLGVENKERLLEAAAGSQSGNNGC